MKDQTETDRQLAPVTEPTPVLKLLYTASVGLRDVRHPISNKELFIGRTVSGDTGLALGEDRRASARHARVQGAREGVFIEDAGSRNGTWVNGQKLQGPLRLVDGDVVRLGSSLLLLRYEPAKPEDAPREQRALHDALRGQAPALRAARHLLSRAAPRPDAVLILGETGSGKELAAQALHELSGRPGALVACNCANLMAALAESQLFGHAKGAFTGAQLQHPGFFREAAAGTLFLDEIGELPIDLQPKLLRALESRVIRPVGATRDEPCDVRIVAATNRDLNKAVRADGFRSDLLARISTLMVTLPPLRERREDILPLFLRLLGERRLSAPLAEAMLLYPWPLNVRGLIRLAAHVRAFVDADTELDLPSVHTLLEPVMPQEPSPQGAEFTQVPDPLKLTKYTRELVTRLMAEESGVLIRVAKRLHLSRRQLGRVLAKYDIEPNPFRRKLSRE